MDYLPYTAGQATVTERWITLTDGVKLKLIDFQPQQVGTDADGQPLRPMLFVAGWISLLEGWKNFLPTFTPHRRVLYLETREKISAQLPNNHEDKQAVLFDMPRMVQDLAEVVTAENLSSGGYELVGSSLGATAIAEFLALEQSTEQPAALPHKAVLIAPNADFPFPKWGVPLMRHAPSFLWTVFKPLIKWYLRTFRVEEPEQAAKYEKTIESADIFKLRRNAITLIDYQIWPRLSKIVTPTLVIAASSDKLHGIDNIERMGREIPNATTTILDSNKATHAQPCSNIIQEFLRGTSS